MAKTLTYPLPQPTNPAKIAETGGTVTHALQVLHTLQWHHPGGRALVQLAQAPTQDYHSYTHTLLGVVKAKVSWVLATLL